jgi:hypothetical protein
MKQSAVALLLVVGMALGSLSMTGCGTSANPASINGVWNATLLGTNQETMFTFGTSLVVNADGTLSITNFQFSTNSPCFVSGESESGSFTLSGNFDGQVNGTFNFIVKSGSPSGNTLSLTGTATGNTISGNWTLSGGTGCTGSGNFTMTRM